MLNKGEPVRFKRGKYKGKSGWHNADKTEKNTTHRVYVLVDLGNNRLKATFVKPSSISKRRAHSPSNYAEAMLDQQPDIEGLIEQLCFEIARCNIHDDFHEAPQHLYDAIHIRMTEAIEEQAALGYNATWRLVDYE